MTFGIMTLEIATIGITSFYIHVCKLKVIIMLPLMKIHFLRQAPPHLRHIYAQKRRRSDSNGRVL
jgi:hypothetical protein